MLVRLASQVVGGGYCCKRDSQSVQEDRERCEHSYLGTQSGAALVGRHQSLLVSLAVVAHGRWSYRFDVSLRGRVPAYDG